MIILTDLNGFYWSQTNSFMSRVENNYFMHVCPKVFKFPMTIDPRPSIQLFCNNYKSWAKSDWNRIILKYSVLYWKVPQDYSNFTLDCLNMALRDENNILDQIYDWDVLHWCNKTPSISALNKTISFKHWVWVQILFKYSFSYIIIKFINLHNKY